MLGSRSVAMQSFSWRRHLTHAALVYCSISPLHRDMDAFLWWKRDVLEDGEDGEKEVIFAGDDALTTIGWFSRRAKRGEKTGQWSSELYGEVWWFALYFDFHMWMGHAVPVFCGVLMLYPTDIKTRWCLFFDSEPEYPMYDELMDHHLPTILVFGK